MSINFDTFVEKVKDFKTVPSADLADTILSTIQVGNSDCHKYFYGGSTSDFWSSTQDPATKSELSNLSLLYTCFALSNVSSHGFNKTVDAPFSKVQTWFDSHSATVGQSVFLYYAFNSSRLGPWKNSGDCKKFANTLAPQIGNPFDFLTPFLTECDKDLLPVKVMLLAFEVMDKGGENFQHVLSVWQKHPRWGDISDYGSFPWLGTVAPLFITSQQRFQTIYLAVSGACNKQQVSKQEHYDVTVYGPLPDGYDITTIYGSPVVQWLKSSSGPKVINGLRTSNNPSNVEHRHTGGAGGCVRAGTPIAMADGSTKPIELIQEGDRILSGNGTISVSSGELVVNRHIEEMYSFNADEPFMTFEHAVMTQRGWCSMAPELTRELVPHISVGQLSVGDIVWRLKSGATPSNVGDDAYDKVVVKQINLWQCKADECPPVAYDLHLESGQRSFHTNGYCCLLTFPVITPARIATNVATNLSPAEQIDFTEKFGAMMPHLIKALGPGVATATMAALSGEHDTHTPGSTTDGKILLRDRGGGSVDRVNQHPSAKGIVRPVACDAIVPSMRVLAGANKSKLADDLHTIAVAHSNVLIGGKPVSTQVDKAGHLQWTRHTSAGIENGALQLFAHGLAGHGTVSYDGASPIKFDAVGQVEYNMTYTPEESSADESWYPFEMGFAKDEKGNLHAEGKVVDSLDPDLQKYSTVVFSVVKGQLHAEIEFDPTWVEFGGSKWIAAELDFTPNYSAISGKLYPYDVNSDDRYRGKALHLRGFYKNALLLNNLFKQMTELHQKEPLNTLFLEKPAAPVDRSLSAIQTSVSALYSLPPPDMTLVHQTSFAKMKNLMLLALSRDKTEWLEWFGETAPSVGPNQSLSDADALLLENSDIKDFLVNEFAKGYLTQAFSTSSDDKIKKMMDGVKDLESKLGYFWRGDGDKSFASLKGYKLVSSKLFRSTYAELVPELNEYMTSTDSAVGWARQLYEYCTTEPTLTGLALQNSLDGRQHLTNLTSILAVLDPLDRIKTESGKDISYATDLYEKVVDLRLKQITKFATIANKQDMIDFLTEYFKAYFNSLLDGDKWEDSIRASATKELNDLMKEFGTSTVNETVEEIGGIISDAVDAMFKLKGTMPARIRNWAEGHPKLSKAITRTVTMGVYGFGMYQSITSFVHWKELTPVEKAQTIINFLDLTVNIFNDVATWRAATNLTKLGSSMDEVVAAVSEIQDSLNATSVMVTAEEVTIMLGDGSVSTLEAGGMTAAKAMNEATEAAEAASRWTRISTISEGVAKGMNIVALGAACVITAFQIANDFSTDQSVAIKALDIASEVAGGVAFLAAAGGGIAAMMSIEVASAIPIIGAVAAVVGVVIAIVLLFVHRKPPPTPQEKFVQSVAVPFANQLLKPPQKWTDQQKKAQEHLNKKESSDALLAVGVDNGRAAEPSAILPSSSSIQQPTQSAEEVAPTSASRQKKRFWRKIIRRPRLFRRTPM